MRNVFNVIALSSVTLLSSTQLYSYYACPNGSCDNYSRSYQSDNYQGQRYYNEPRYQRDQRYSSGPYEYDQRSDYRAQKSYEYDQRDGYRAQRPYEYDQRDDYRSQRPIERQENQGYYDDNRSINDSGRQYNEKIIDSRENMQERVSDQTISKNIRDVLSAGMMSKGYPNVRFEVRNGAIKLSGSVYSEADKKNIEEKVRKINGIRHIDNQITLIDKETGYHEDSYDTESSSAVKEAKKNYPQDIGNSEADKKLNTKIREKISDGSITQSYEEIILKTRNGIVVIQGFVDSKDDIDAINKKLKDIDGIRSVNNQLQIKK